MITTAIHQKRLLQDTGQEELLNHHPQKKLLQKHRETLIVNYSLFWTVAVILYGGKCVLTKIFFKVWYVMLKIEMNTSERLFYRNMLYEKKKENLSLYVRGALWFDLSREYTASQFKLKYSQNILLFFFSTSGVLITFRILAEELRKTFIALASNGPSTNFSPDALFHAVWRVNDRFVSVEVLIS